MVCHFDIFATEQAYNVKTSQKQDVIITETHRYVLTLAFNNADIAVNLAGKTPTYKR
jgi:hypothetical protein